MNAVLLLNYNVKRCILGYWPFGLVFCSIWQVSDVTMCTSSIMHMCTISMDRYMGIKDPLKARNRSRLTVAVKIIAVWLLSLAIASPLIFLGLYRPEEILGRDLQCAIFNTQFLVYGSLAAFFLPLLVMLVTYSLTIRMLSERARQLERREREGMRRSLSRKRDRKTQQADPVEVSTTTRSATSSGGMTTVGDSGSPDEVSSRQSGSGSGIPATGSDESGAGIGRFLEESVKNGTGISQYATGSAQNSIKTCTSATGSGEYETGSVPNRTGNLAIQVGFRRLFLSVDENKMTTSCLVRSSQRSDLAKPHFGSSEKIRGMNRRQEMQAAKYESEGSIPNGVSFVPEEETDAVQYSDLCDCPEVSQDAEELLIRDSAGSRYRHSWILSDPARPFVIISVPERHGSTNDPDSTTTAAAVTTASCSCSPSAGLCSCPSSTSPGPLSKFRSLVNTHTTAIRLAGLVLPRPRRTSQSQPHPSSSLSSVKTEQKAVKVLGTMFFLFVACWASFFVVNLSMGLCSDCQFHETMFKCFLWLGYSSSMLNPIIYTVFNKAFKATFVRLLTCVPCRELTETGAATYRIQLSDQQPRSKNPGWIRSQTLRLKETKL